MGRDIDNQTASDRQDTEKQRDKEPEPIQKRRRLYNAEKTQSHIQADIKMYTDIIIDEWRHTSMQRCRRSSSEVDIDRWKVVNWSLAMHEGDTVSVQEGVAEVHVVYTENNWSTWQEEKTLQKTPEYYLWVGSTVLASVDTCFLYLRVCKLVCAYASMSLDKR